MDLKDFGFDQWWRVVTAAGGLTLVAATGAAFAPGVLIGLGLTAFGAAEWSMVHRIEQPILGQFNQPIGSHFVLMKRRSAAAVAVQCLGIGLLAVGVVSVAIRG